MYDAANILLFIHLVALVVGAATNVAMPLVMRQMAKATPDAKAGYGAIARQLGFNAQVALGVLVLSGIVLVWIRYGGVAGLDAWFWAKMALVALIVVLMIVRFMPVAAGISPRVFASLTRLVLLGIVLTAVFAFN